MSVEVTMHAVCKCAPGEKRTITVISDEGVQTTRAALHRYAEDSGWLHTERGWMCDTCVALSPWRRRWRRLFG